MAHVSERRWRDINMAVGNMASQLLDVLGDAQELYLQLLEVYAYAGADDTLFAKQLFADEIAARGGGEPTADELARVVDAREAVVAMNQIWQATQNIAVAASDRAKALRQMA